MLDFQWFSLIVFFVLLTSLVVYKRKSIEIQKMLFPVVYAGLYRSNFGLNFINKFSGKYNVWVKLFGYCSVGFGFAGLVAMVFGIIYSLFVVFTVPSAPSSVGLLLPQTNIPGLGFLPFWYWIIALFVIVLVHEFSHGIVAKAHGLSIKSSGLGFFSFFLPVIPVAFVEPDETGIEKAPDIVQYSIFSAGPFSNILTALLVFIVFSFVFSPVDRIVSEPAGFSFSKINSSYPAFSLPGGLVVSRFNGRVVNDLNDFYLGLYCVAPGSLVSIGNSTHNFSISTVSAPDNEKMAFIGVNNLKNVRSVKPGFSLFYPFYVWLRGLVKWIGWLSLFVGTANLLPIGPIDGGRMIKVLSSKVIKDRAKAKRRWVSVSLLVIALILLSFLWPLVKKLF
jgi:membrane-associated protease RseP (regulator of RpoE activity)